MRTQVPFSSQQQHQKLEVKDYGDSETSQGKRTTQMVEDVDCQLVGVSRKAVALPSADFHEIPENWSHVVIPS